MRLLPLHLSVFNGRKGASVRPSASVSALRGLCDTLRLLRLRFCAFCAFLRPTLRPPTPPSGPRILRFTGGDPLACSVPRGLFSSFRFFRAAKTPRSLPRQDEATENSSLGARPPLDRRSASRFSPLGDRRHDAVESVDQPGLRRGGIRRRALAAELHRGTHRLKYLSPRDVAPPDQGFFKNHLPGLASLPLHHTHRGRTGHRGGRVGSNCH